MENSANVEIDRPIEEVFRLTCEDVEKWSNVVVSDEVIEQTPDMVGTTFLTVTEENGKRMEFQGVVTKNEPPYAHAAQMTGSMFDIETEFTFEDLGGKTRVNQYAKVTGKGFFKLFLFLFGWMMHKQNCDASAKELESLKQYCERDVLQNSE